MWYFVILLLSVNTGKTAVESWTSTQLSLANTAHDIPYLSTAEKETILYINLARSYPALFLKYELQEYTGPIKYGDYLTKSTYKKSLSGYLKKMKPVAALQFDPELFQNAKCFSEELGVSGRTGHQRKQCTKKNYAECLSYGMPTGKDIAMQLLIDHNVSSLGHRKICLQDSYTKIGVSIHDHKKWETCAVLELIW